MCACVYVDVRMRVWANASVSVWRIPLLPCPVLTCACVCFVCACVRVTPSLQICNRICGSGQCLSTENLQGFTSAQNYIRDSRWGIALAIRVLAHSIPFSAGLSRSFRESRNPPGRENTGFQALRSVFSSFPYTGSALLFPKEHRASGKLSRRALGNRQLGVFDLCCFYFCMRHC